MVLKNIGYPSKLETISVHKNITSFTETTDHRYFKVQLI